MNYKKVFQDAKQILEDGGWIQHNLSTSKGCCMMGAVIASLKRNKPTVDGISDMYAVTGLNLLRDTLEEETPNKSRFITEFNDAPNRTKEEVIDIFDKIIAKL